MIITRASFAELFTSILSLTITSDDSFAQVPQEPQELQQGRHKQRPLSCNTCHTSSPEIKYHPPPYGVNYETNPTVFGRILDGTIPSSTIMENEELITICDRHPKAPLHGLVIPKRYIESVKSLNNDDLDTILHMKESAMEILKCDQPNAYANNDYILCFHVPPFISVGHLHLHVLAPASEMQIQYRWGKYLVGTRWCSDVDEIINVLRDVK